MKRITKTIQENEANVTKKNITLNELITLPMQHLCRYKLLFDVIDKSAFKIQCKGEAAGENTWVNVFRDNIIQGRT